MMHYLRIPTKRFEKDLRRLSRSGADLSRLENIINILVTDESLPAIYLDHPLRGALQGTRACHIGPDWLLRYAKDGKHLLLLLISTGDHRQVLNVE